MLDDRIKGIALTMMQLGMLTDEAALEMKKNWYATMTKSDRAALYNEMVKSGVDPHDLRGVNE
ncbi:hypothetical protein HWN39_10580 [Lactobacillus rhamnosus]|uniref:Uncharacterized protein n=1 Tax=Lacticaseibacillus rhamnosus TaxID=47715 RepID=A0A7Y7QH80_LACRH|nr:hypothetical protein [Lacticaseibacillus rhamnosus]NVO88923.1 hypothetical protein [Lacticaseibacillus rhamnosus]